LLGSLSKACRKREPSCVARDQRQFARQAAFSIAVGRRHVSGKDLEAVKLNRTAFKQLKCEKLFALVPGATRLFEEPGALDEAAALARRWYQGHLVG
jgi:hypothetical protein